MWYENFDTTVIATKLEFLTEKESSHNEDDVPQNESLKNGEDEETGDEAEDEELKDGKGDKDDSDQHISSGKTKKLMNQFNFCERATITYENTLKVNYKYWEILKL